MQDGPQSTNWKLRYFSNLLLEYFSCEIIPEKIFISSNLKDYVEQFIDKKNIEVLISNKTIQSGFIKEQIEVKFNIFSKLLD